MKAELNKDNRIKRMENYEAMDSIRKEIAAKIQLELGKELSAYTEENKKSVKEEKEFFTEVSKILRNSDVCTKLKVVTQVGKGSTILNEYVGNLAYKPEYSATHFNFISEQRDNGGNPFTIGFSCLQSIEVLQ
jgi:hypothetical protein